jgi:Matrixin
VVGHRRVISTGVLAVAAALLGTPAAAAGAVGTPDTAIGATIANGSGASTPATVTAVTTGGNGVTTVTLYTPAAGVSAQQLYQKLRARGVPGLQQPHAADSTGPGVRSVSPAAGVGLCGYGTSTAIACPPAHWARNGYAHPQVYFIDNTSSAWPVAAAVPPWNQAHGVDSLYRFATCPAAAGIHCVTTTNGNFGDTGWDGQTNMQIDANHNFVDGMSIQFNDYYQETASEHRTVTCHELGHALGLDHNSSTNSCMFAGGAPSATTPAADDYTLLADIYSSF